MKTVAPTIQTNKEYLRKELKALTKNKRLGALFNYATNQIAVTLFENRTVYVKPNALNQLDLWDMENSKLVHCFTDAHTTQIYSVAATSDRSLILSGSADNTIAVWSLLEKALLHRFENAHTGAITSLAVTPNSKLAVSASWDKSIAIWDLVNNKLVYRFEAAHSDDIWTIAVSANNEYIVSAGEDRIIAVWSISKKKIHHRFVYAHCDTICSVAMTSDCRYIISGSADGTVNTWDLESKTCVEVLESVGTVAVRSVAVSEDSKYFYYGTEDGRVAVCELLRNKQEIQSLADNESTICYLTVSSLQKNDILCSTFDGDVIVWDPFAKGKHNIKKQLKHSMKDPIDLCITAESKYILAATTRNVFVWSFDEKKLVHVFEEENELEEVQAVATTPDSKQLITASQEGKITFWDLERFEFIEKIDAPTQKTSLREINIRVTRDGEKLIYTTAPEDYILVLRLSDKEVIHKLEEAQVKVISLTKDSRYLAAGTETFKISVWDLSEMKLVRRFEEPSKDWVVKVAFTPDGYLMSGAVGGNICIWDFKNEEKEEPQKSFKITEFWPSFVVLDDKMLYIGHEDERTLKILNYKTLKEKSEDEEPEKGKSFAYRHIYMYWGPLTLTTDDKYLIAPTNEGIEVWNTSDFSLQGRCNSLSTYYFRSQFTITPDSKQIICIAMSGRIEIWNLNDNTFECSFENIHLNRISSLAVSSDGNTLVSGGSGGSIAIWDLKTRKFNSLIEKGHTDDITLIGISHNNTKIVSLTSKAISIWNTSDRSLVHTVSNNSKKEELFKCMALSKVSDYMVVGSADKSLKIFHIGDKTEVGKISEAHTQPASSVVLASADKYIISGSPDNSVAIWDFKTKVLVHRFSQVHKDGVTSVAVDSASKYIFASSNSGSISFFDLKEMKQIHHEAKVHSSKIDFISPTPDGKFLVSASSDYTIGLYKMKEDLLASIIETGHTEHINAIAVSKDGNLLITSSHDKTIIVFDLHRKLKLHQFKDAHLEWVLHLALTNDSKYLISTSTDKTMAVWNLEEMKLHHRFTIFQEGTLATVALPDCRTVVCSSWDKSIGVFDIVNKAMLYQIFDAHDGGTTALAFSRDGRYLISGGEDGTIALWSHKGNDYKLLRRIKSPSEGSVDFLETTLNNQHIVACVQDTLQIYKFDQREDEPPIELKNDRCKGIQGLILSEDTRYLFGSSLVDSSIFIWDLQKMSFFCRIRDARFKDIQEIAISSDMRHIVCVLEDRKAIAVVNSTFISSDPLIQNDRMLMLRTIGCYLNTKEFSTEECKETLKVLAKYHFLPKEWDYLHFVAFLLPDVDSSLIDVAKESQVSFSFDIYDKTPLDYMLEYPGAKKMQVQQFFTYFFKNVSSLVNLKALNPDKMLLSLSDKMSQIFETQTEASFLNFLKCFAINPEEHLKNYQNLPVQGDILDGEAKSFAQLKALEYNEEEVRDVISREGKLTLKYLILGLPSSYNIYSKDSLNIMWMMNDSQDVLFYESPIVKNLIDYYWKKSTKSLWLWMIVNLIPVGLFTAFALLRADDHELSSQLLVGTTAISALFLIFDILQMTADASEYFQNPFNFIELLIVTVQFLTAGLFWSGTHGDMLSFFVSLSLLLWYTKLLVLMRMIDQLRYLIRMIIEIFVGSLSFMMVIFTYVVAFTIAMYQSRKETESPDFWDVALEMYTFGVGTYDNSNYSGITMPFFILATILMPLILLNMLIALMGDIYERAKEDAVCINAKERIAMISEISSTVIQLKKIYRWITRRPERTDRQKYYILIVEPYEVHEDIMTVENLMERQNAKIQIMQDQLALIGSGVKSLKDKFQYDIDVIRDELNVIKNDSKTSNELMKAELSQISSLLKKALKIEE